MASQSKRREKDFKNLNSWIWLSSIRMMADYKVELINDSMHEFYVEFHGPKDSPYYEGVWRIRVELPEAYPYKSPSIGFVNKIYHPNVDEMSGSVCLDVINQVWNPMFDLVKVFEVFLPQLLLYPNASDPMNGEAADLMMRDHDSYEQRVKKYCKKYAKPQDHGASSNEKCSNEELRGICSRERKQGGYKSFSEMLSWLRHVAKHSHDPKAGHEEFLTQAMFVREALFTRHSNKNAGQNLQQDQHKKQKTHPTVHEGKLLDNNQWTEKLRCTNKTTYLTKGQDSYPTPHSKVTIHQPKEAQNSVKAPSKPVLTKKVEPPPNSEDHKPIPTPAHKHVLVGPDFQANVPQWTGLTSESDPKWLGTRMWALENGEIKSTVGLNDFPCNCRFPNSVECFRFHIAEKRFKLKRELGALFYRWRFDRMGEEVSLSWMREEERIFKDLMRSYLHFPEKFWNNAYRLLPAKKREDLVSYYFNVYVIQRRSYQNRITPKDLDSDDDEKECGVIGDSFGYKALRGLGFESLSCTVNMQSTELQ